MFIGSVFVKLIVAGGLINVWVFRNSRSTEYRGGEATNLKEEFKVYGLSEWTYYLVGFLKLASALTLLASILIPSLRDYASGLIAALMLGAVIMHFKVNDPLKKTIPALAMLIMSASLLFIK